MTKMPTTQEATTDPTDDLVALLVPPRQSRLRTAFVCLAVLAALAGFTALRSSGVVVPRLRAELRSSAVGPGGDVTVVMRVSNDGRTTARIEGVDANENGLSQPAIATHLPLTLAAGKRVDITMHWKAHNCLGVTHGEAGHFGIRARSGLPVATEREYPVRTSDTFMSRLDPRARARSNRQRALQRRHVRRMGDERASVRLRVRALTASPYGPARLEEGSPQEQRPRGAPLASLCVTS